MYFEKKPLEFNVSILNLFYGFFLAPLKVLCDKENSVLQFFSFFTFLWGLKVCVLLTKVQADLFCGSFFTTRTNTHYRTKEEPVSFGEYRVDMYIIIMFPFGLRINNYLAQGFLVNLESFHILACQFPETVLII